MRLQWVVLVLSGLVACGGPPDRDDFERDFAGIWCEREQQCALGDFESKYSDLEDCWSDEEDDLKISSSDDASCEIDGEEADDCLDWMESTECADWEQKNVEDSCDRVFIDC